MAAIIDRLGELIFLESDAPLEHVKLVPAKKSDIPNMAKWEMDTTKRGYPNQTIDDDDMKNIEKEIYEDAADSVWKTRMVLYDNKTIGMITAYNIEDPAYTGWYIGEIYIIKEYRGRGIGKALLEKEMEEHDEIMLNVYKENKGAIKLYTSLGFMIVEDSDNRFIMKYVKGKPQPMTMQHLMNIRWNEAKSKEYNEQVQEGKIPRENDKGEPVPEKCDVCGSDVEVFLKGEPVWLCKNKDCKKYFGTVPCNVSESFVETFGETAETSTNGEPMELLPGDVQNTPVSTNKRDNLMKVDDLKCDELYFGSPVKSTYEMKLDRPLFVTPFKGIASIFAGRTKLSEIGVPPGSYNSNYDEWGLPLKELQKPLKVVHMYIEGYPELEETVIERTGYIHCIPFKDYKDNIYRYNWMSEDVEYLIAKVDKVRITRVIKCTVKYIIKGAPARKPGQGPYEPIQEGAWNDIKNGVNPLSNKTFFHISMDDSLNGKTLNPRIPSYLSKSGKDDKYYEDDEIPRVCFSNSIEGALNAIVTVGDKMLKVPQGIRYYVYIPEKPLSEYKHKTNKELIKEKLVFDATTTGECWIMEPVKLKLYGVIMVDQITDVKEKKTVSGIPFRRTDYKWKWVVHPRVVDRTSERYFSSDPVSICESMCDMMKNFKYGMPANGKISNNFSAKDYDEKYKLLSPDEFEKYGGGICYDYVEYAGSYLEKNGLKCKKYFISTETDDNDTHTFITADDGNGGLLYPESSFKLIEGVHKVDGVDGAIKLIVENMFKMNGNDKKYDSINYYVWEYHGHPPYGSNIEQCMRYFSKGEPFHEGSVKNPNK